MSDPRLLRQIAARMSLRKPQIESLDILADLFEHIEFTKKPDPVAVLDTIKAGYPSVEDFERDFPSLCFALATGVGKTRLMGAFVTWLYQAGRSRNFFVLAPNTTIYDKLIADFTPGTPKYVFKGIAEFAQNPPNLVTGENWMQGRDLLGEAASVRVTIFNVDKINKEAGRIRRLHEYIGESFFDYLAGLPDLVLLMDEAHRYRGKAAFKALADLKPMLGLELTATPKTVGAKSVTFRNVIYHYDLAQAMADGFVKEPAVATRKDFDSKSVDETELERIKLEDGVHAHENVKLRLREYAERTGEPLVHPFMLVVAQDIQHAEALKAQVEGVGFFGGRYNGRTITVHSNKTGEESDEAQARLVAVEHDDQTEIVIHVNKLKEGWDVTNLYTIVPLRASASDILTEQTLGRGLRLPYGMRTGEEAIDTLTVIAHDRFDDVIQKAKEPGSLVQKAMEIGPDGKVWTAGSYEVTATTSVEAAMTGRNLPGIGPGLADPPAPDPIFAEPASRTVAEVTVQVIRRMERELSGSERLKSEEVRAKIVGRVEELTKPVQSTLEGVIAKPDIKAIVDAVTTRLADGLIEIPEIVVLPEGRVSFSFRDFDLAVPANTSPQPMSNEILVQQLRTDHRTSIARSMRSTREDRPEDYLVGHLMDHDEVDYDSCADLLYKLSGQMVAHLRSYLGSNDDIENVLLNHGKALAGTIFTQMMAHYEETPTTYRATVARGFHVLEPLSFRIAGEDALCDFRAAVKPLSDTPRRVFVGFRKCIYPYQSFQSDPERRFAVIVDANDDPTVMKWVKPGRKQFDIEYRRTERYEPDFVVETRTEKLIVEIKARNELDDSTVKAKAEAARTWVGHANAHARTNGGKPWRYLLVPDDAIAGNTTLKGLVSNFSQAEIVPAGPPPTTS
ncbi:MAG: DEAD/DEAH box helicase [Reyranella sp.]